MKHTQYKYVQVKVSKGKAYYYFRKGKTYIRLPNDPDSEEFSREYWAIRSGKKARPSKTSWRELVTSYFRSPKYLRLADGTRANYRRHIDAILEKNADKDMTGFRRKDAIASRDALQDTWSKANERVAVLSALCKHAVDREWIERNPVVDIEKLDGGEYEPWPAEKLLAFERFSEAESLEDARTVFELAIGTGQRIGDVVAMKWADFDGQFMQVTQDKTDTKLSIFCPARLRTYLSRLTKRGDYILAKNLRQHLSKSQAQKKFAVVQEGIGVKKKGERAEYVLHGLRYTAATELAEAGCSDSDIAAVTGHKTLSMVQKYRAKANQKRASKRAQELREQNKNET